MIKAITVLSAEFQEVYPNIDGHSVGGMRHYKTPCKNLMSEETYKQIAHKTKTVFSTSNTEVRQIQIVDIKRVQDVKKPAKAKVKDNE